MCDSREGPAPPLTPPHPSRVLSAPSLNQIRAGPPAFPKRVQEGRRPFTCYCRDAETRRVGCLRPAAEAASGQGSGEPGVPPRPSFGGARCWSAETRVQAHVAQKFETTGSSGGRRARCWVLTPRPPPTKVGGTAAPRARARAGSPATPRVGQQPPCRPVSAGPTRENSSPWLPLVGTITWLVAGRAVLTRGAHLRAGPELQTPGAGPQVSPGTVRAPVGGSARAWHEETGLCLGQVAAQPAEPVMGDSGVGNISVSGDSQQAE